MIGNQSRLRTGQCLAAATAAVLLALAARWAGQGLIKVTPDGIEGHMHMQSEDAGSPAQITAEQWRFSSQTLVRARRIAQLEHSFDADPQLAALTTDLIEEVHQLRRQLKALKR